MSPTIIPSCPCLSLLVLCPYLPWAWRELTNRKNYWGDFWTMDRGTGGCHLQEERVSRGGILFFPELFRFDCVDVKSFLMETYVPQLVKVICKSIFLPLESTIGYQKALFSTILVKFLTGFIMQRLCLSSIAFCVYLWIQNFKYQGNFLWGFTLCSLKYDLYFFIFHLGKHQLWYMDKVEKKTEKICKESRIVGEIFFKNIALMPILNIYFLEFQNII